ncbi:helix-turn-helix transcriptional regulator [Wenyingzhuangia marina]|uniref:Predicted DNA-binding transcriptional regulator YafY, contains an HTH and WYL domains n=1 Tax=Wenyingzhuangia marina TaxID=1195760 RepID=A0A1M5S724_9FLAO|nr:WYL domain-containing protein [Wenyingzhuangia marina]GGF79129.1 WYL domain-containing protein [Wenyingzhuangia marina]SHH34286.1 Predicted DNA-binding transcriptional regulator YafY, contains an HTH and WYL domains [Wenyingzhuangia marina]
MPKNKNYQKRITVLDECFASRTGLYTLEKLEQVILEKLEIKVSKRTIQNDIDSIRDIIENDIAKDIDVDQYPVFQTGLYEGKKKVFRYAKAEYALGNQLLSKSDQEQLEDTLAILARYRNREEFNWLDELFPRIQSAFELVHEDYSGLISYETNRDYTGQSWVGKLYNQLVKGKILNIEYKTFASETSYIRKVHPYHLKQYNSRWFLFGYEEGENYTGITNLALDRIVSITETTENSLPNTIDWGDYFDEIIGVSKPNDIEPIDIKLRFSSSRIQYVSTKPIHGASQRMDKTDPENRTIIINVIPNRELYQTLLSFGNDVEVIEPDFIKKELLESK